MILHGSVDLDVFGCGKRKKLFAVAPQAQHCGSGEILFTWFRVFLHFAVLQSSPSWMLMVPAARDTAWIPMNSIMLSPRRDLGSIYKLRLLTLSLIQTNAGKRQQTQSIRSRTCGRNNDICSAKGSASLVRLPVDCKRQHSNIYIYIMFHRLKGQGFRAKKSLSKPTTLLSARVYSQPF